MLHSLPLPILSIGFMQFAAIDPASCRPCAWALPLTVFHMLMQRKALPEGNSIRRVPFCYPFF